uniref:Uncharacterized protein n=1 Tax=viral metagenome TaxID=1070528 RepID=A0A6M3L1J7_9ZZZZ
MTKYSMIFRLTVFGVISAGIAFAIYRADQGSVAAGALLGAIGAIILLTISAALIIGTQYALSTIEQRRFTSNARENLQIMGTMAATQGQQNRLMSQQLKQLPKPDAQDMLIIDDAIFSELE